MIFDGKIPKSLFRDFQSVDKPLDYLKMGCRVLLALLVLHRAKLLASNQSILALGRSPSNIAPFPGKGVFGKDAEIRTRRALHEAKPSECPKGDRDNKSEVYFKNRLFLQAEIPKSLFRDFLFIF